MADTLDLLKIAQEEQNGDLFKHLDGIYKRSKVQPVGMSDAVIWEGGNNAGGVKPVAHAFTDMFALNGTIMAMIVPFSANMSVNAWATGLTPPALLPPSQITASDMPTGWTLERL